MITSVPMTASEIATALGISTTNAGDFFNANIVNKNSKNKPVVCDTGGNPITDVQRRAANFGFSFTSWDVSASGNWNAMLDAAIAGNFGWTYNMPTANCRLGDFYGYEHAAVNEFFLTGQDLSGYIALTFGHRGNISGSLIGTDFGTDCKYGILWRLKGSGNSAISTGAVFPVSESPCAHTISPGNYGTYQVALFAVGFDYARPERAVLVPTLPIEVTITEPQDTYNITVTGIYSGLQYYMRVLVSSNTGYIAAQTLRITFITATSSSEYIELTIPTLNAGEFVTVTSDWRFRPTKDEITSFYVTYGGKSEYYTPQWIQDIGGDIEIPKE